MAKVGTFICTKANGRMKLFDREGFDAVLAEYGDGEDFQLHIEEVGRKRTRAQNRFFHGPIVKAFMTEGRHRQEAKDMLCLMFIPRDVRMPNGTIVRVPGHTSDLDVEQFNDLIDVCMQLAAEQDIYIMDGGEWRAKLAQDARTARKAS